VVIAGVAMVKICTKCGKEKKINEFYKDKDCRFGFMAHCKDCKGKYTSEHAKKYKTRRHELYLSNKDEYKNNSLLKKFGITLDQYNKMLESQNGVCAICGKDETVIDGKSKIVRSLAVDHNHKTGKVRGLLCVKCNNMLGLINENEQILLKTLEYLRYNKG
jgi:Recombination endonuclease VII